jgi:hypothetical protein
MEIQDETEPNRDREIEREHDKEYDKAYQPVYCFLYTVNKKLQLIPGMGIVI